MKYSHRKYLKALEALVLVVNKEQRHYWALKAIYFADKEHLRRYGRQIFDDSYRAMRYGPVPSLAYDIVKYVRGDGWVAYTEPDPSAAINIPDKYTIKPLRKPDEKMLSKSDIECLDYGYNVVKDLDFDELHKKSCDAAYDEAGLDEDMSIESIIKTLDNSEEVLEYLKEG